MKRYTINSSVIDKIKFVNRKNILSTIVVWPFLLIYLIPAFFYYGDNGLETGVMIGVIFLLHTLILLSTYWNIRFRCFVFYSTSEDVLRSGYVSVTPHIHSGFGAIVPLEKNVDNEEGFPLLTFTFQNLKFICEDINKDIIEFKLLDFPENLDYSKYLNYHGYDDKSIELAKKKWANNEIKIPIPSFWDLFKDHIFAPFFVLQLFCVLLWCLDEYMYYSLFTLLMLFVFESTLVNQRLTHLKTLNDMRPSSYQIYVFRAKWMLVSTDDLYPGDIVLLRPNPSDLDPLLIPCDIMLISGTCIVNESLLTGESVPQTKDSLSVNTKNDVKRCILYSGTELLQSLPFDNNYQIPLTPVRGSIGYVMKTGFYTSQGELIRTMLYSSERMTANNKEAFTFIGILLLFAVASSSYVLYIGLNDPLRDKWKLLLHCIMIITSVIPPELPMELSLAVTQSMASLTKIGIFCTEPFRIPIAGKVDICCFDKTGTLTTEEIDVLGVSDCDGNLLERNKISSNVALVLAGCHNLLYLENKLVGDPLEKSALNYIGWIFARNSSLYPDVDYKKIYGEQTWEQRKIFPFSSDLKRMSTIVKSHSKYLLLTKGAPDVLIDLISNPPPDYINKYRKFTKEGCRVISLCIRQLTHEETELPREKLECNLQFVGLLILQSPLKVKSRSVCKKLISSSHNICMITGDDPFTACAVASECKMVDLKRTLILNNNSFWLDVETNNEIPYATGQLPSNYSYCLTGQVLDDFPKQLLPKIKVFARVSPFQKSYILMAFKELNNYTLMAGDGTNDVGALKQSDVGVSIINHVSHENKKKTSSKLDDPFARMLEQASQAEESGIVKLGDASIASPFTCKSPSVTSILCIIRQGRCTLVVTFQMYKILALNCLVTAYMLSILYIVGVKQGDSQMTYVGFIIAFLFFSISLSKPLNQLSEKRPKSSIFNFNDIISIGGQFLFHIVALVYLKRAVDPFLIDLPVIQDEDFHPNIMNTVMFLASTIQQCITFSVNYQGHPFMQSMTENRLFLILLSLLSVGLIVCVYEIIPDLNETLELVEIPDPIKWALTIAIFSDWAASYLWDYFSQTI